MTSNDEGNTLEKGIFKEDLEVKILDSKETILTKDKTSRIQFHPFIYFYFIAEGSGTFFIENDSIKVRQNDLVIINSNIGHNLYVDGDEYSCRILGFGLESIGVSKKARDSSDDTDIDLENFFHLPCQAAGDSVLYAFNNIIEEFNSDKPFARTMANALASIFIVNFMRYNNQGLKVIDDINVNRQIDYIKSYIDNNYASDIKLEDLSSIAYMNKFHIIAEFKQSYRVTPIEYLILKRIEISKGLLISTNHSMDQIADIVGFNSQSYFNQVFKKKVGITPSQFRKKHRL
ncbi:MAG: AraC family transcriptional regulator [Anaerococcus sp.]|nr:AraC family transcriptional regulator [Anaerococcus sp.]